MLKYKLEMEYNGNKAFLYYSEGREEGAGKIIFNKNGSKEIVEVAKNDVRRLYAFHALSGIDTSKKEGTVAWC